MMKSIKKKIDEIKPQFEKGGKFVICTGRMFSSIRDICLKYGVSGKIRNVEDTLLCFSGCFWQLCMQWHLGLP